jgi:very-short-patch-repair endonuclease
MRLHNLNRLKARRRTLRASLTPAEVRLWSYLQNGQLQGRKFRRQHSVGPFTLDFYCPAEKLAVERDGASHDTEGAMARDEARTEYLAQVGIRVLRFENRDVMQNPDGVLAEISRNFSAG